ncbi:Uma2 family endonuclease [Streptomyces sp. NPDC048002]|uniref:Uma2 family endonuclease n=1 Tax=Streptomyces sp. NPDC048002 TaxID=3154344 RepID=UPI0033C588BF
MTVSSLSGMGMDYAKMRVIAEKLESFAERLEGAWSVEIGPSGPVLAMARRPTRHEGTIRRICEQLDQQLSTTHPGHVCANGPEIEHPAIGRMRLPDAVVIPVEVLDEEGLAVDATRVLAVVEIVSPSNPDNDYVDKLADYPAMGIPPLPDRRPPQRNRPGLLRALGGPLPAPRSLYLRGPGALRPLASGNHRFPALRQGGGRHGVSLGRRLRFPL